MGNADVSQTPRQLGADLESGAAQARGT